MGFYSIPVQLYLVGLESFLMHEKQRVLGSFILVPNFQSIKEVMYLYHIYSYIITNIIDSGLYRICV